MVCPRQGFAQAPSGAIGTVVVRKIARQKIRATTILDMSGCATGLCQREVPL